MKVPLHVVDWQSGERVRTVQVSCRRVTDLEGRVERLLLELPDTQTVDARAAYAVLEAVEQEKTAHSALQDV